MAGNALLEDDDDDEDVMGVDEDVELVAIALAEDAERKVDEAELVVIPPCELCEEDETELVVVPPDEDVVGGDEEVELAVMPLVNSCEDDEDEPVEAPPGDDDEFELAEVALKDVELVGVVVVGFAVDATPRLSMQTLAAPSTPIVST